MNEQLERLIILQDIDSKIIAITRLLEEFPSKLAETELPLSASKTSLGAVMNKLVSLEKKKRDREQSLDDVGEKIKKMKTRTTEIKTNKEYQALLKEIEAVEHERSSAEDDLLVIMEEIENISKLSKTEEVKYNADKQRIEALKKKLEEEKSVIEDELSSVKHSRKSVAGSIESELYDLYINLLNACGGTAVTAAKGEICLGCNMNIPPQLFVEIKKNEEIIHCPQCRRILFFRNNE
ncbi:MAG: C4-type zinc ribbon domain-containing protein [Nitrospirota bacterium]